MDLDFMSVVVLSDWHVGSMYAMWPKDFQASNGVVMPLNDGQEYLLQCRDHMLETLPETIDVLFMNGDMADGINKAEMCRKLVDVDPSFQVRAAENLIRPFADRAGRIIATGGSRYHVDVGSALDNAIAERVGARPDKQGRFARPVAKFDVDGVLFFGHHHQSTTTRYRSMPIEREVSFALEYCGRTGERMPDVFISSHVHWGMGVWMEDDNFVSISTPAMKLQDEYAASGKYPYRWRAHRLGITWIKVYDKPVRGFRAWPCMDLLYKHPDDDVEVEYVRREA